MARTLNYAPAMADDELTEGISLRISTADRELLDALAARLPMKAMTIARLALRIGLAEIDRDPARLFTAAKPSKAKR